MSIMGHNNDSHDFKTNFVSKLRGFTIVELLIVVVVIGILAAIVTVAYTGITTQAKTASTISELKAWQKLFELYKAQFGDYPDPVVSGDGPSNQYYCLGTGFPGGSCQSTNLTGTYGVAESTGATIMTELAKVGTPPSNSSKWTVNYNTGPYLRFIPGATPFYQLQTIIQSTTGCPSGTTAGWYGDATYDHRQHCLITLS